MIGRGGRERKRTEPLLGVGPALDHLEDARLERLERRDVTGQDAHHAALGGDVDLLDLGRGKHRL